MKRERGCSLFLKLKFLSSDSQGGSGSLAVVSSSGGLIVNLSPDHLIFTKEQVEILLISQNVL